MNQPDRPAVVVMAAEEYERLNRRNADTAPPLTSLLLAIPQDDREFERLSLSSRPSLPDRSSES